MSGADRPEFYRHAPAGRRPPADISPMIPILPSIEPPPAGRTNGKPGRKRSRVSKKSTTTLLNTDASNFRAMVQQFTGAPAAPYAGVFAAGGRTPPAAIFGSPTGQPEMLQNEVRQYEYQAPPYKPAASGFPASGFPAIGNMEGGFYGGVEINSGEDGGFFIDGLGGGEAAAAAGIRLPEGNGGGAYFY